MSDDGAEIEARLIEQLAFDPYLEPKRRSYGLPPHPKCPCQECAQWRATNWPLIETLDWDMKPKPKVVEPEPERHPIDELYKIFVERPGHKPEAEDIESGVYREALAQATSTDWPTVKRRMEYIKSKRIQARPTATSVPSSGRSIHK